MLHTPRTCPWRQPSKGRARAYACSAAKAASPAAPPLPSSGPANSKKCVVIGGGIGGLVTAGKLAQHGYSVTVLEKNAEVGGRCQSVWQDGYRFDTGPSLLLFPDEYRKTFEWLGSSLEQHVQLHKIEPAAYRVFFADGYSSSSSSSSSSGSSSSSSSSSGSSHGGDSSSGSYLDLLYDVNAMVQQLERVQQGAGTAYLCWLAEARKALVVGTENFIARDADSIGEFLDLRRLLPLLGQVDVAELLGNHHGRLMRRFACNERIAALLSFQDLYVGLSPYAAPGVFSLLAATELTDGVWYPVGGFCKVCDGLLAVLQQHGVEVRTSACVEQITTANGAVTGVQLAGGEWIQAPLVVTNRDVSMSYGLCDEASGVRHKQRQLASKEYSAGVIAFYWCVSRRLDMLCHHNVFLSDQYKASWQRATTPESFVSHPNFYLHAPARTDPSAAPPGCDSIMVLLPVANIQQRGGDDSYDGLVTAGRRLVLQTLQDAGVGLQPDDIVHEEVRQPAEWRDLYALEHGAAFGLSHGLDQLAILRPPLKEPQLQGLYFVGASSRPGNGVPLVMMGGRLAAERILSDAAAAADVSA
ncbi:hypothetical protein OEZ85_006938 [Tetradesmus obliquus]|uniref:Amine oxidase domain-containing protein n=1 Tax=Tetradesmus obliquus TaxID=3088 RepID=A0ABY8TYM9_TETOB|nr:hypothetical protein OEZ85_006938 [Tetradesmus obliquus]